MTPDRLKLFWVFAVLVAALPGSLGQVLGTRSSTSCPPGQAKQWPLPLAPCAACGVGTWSRGGANALRCRPCPAGMTTLQEGAASAAKCVCKAGFGYNARASNKCQRCKKGTYSAGGLNPCTACSPAGATTRVAGATSPSLCRVASIAPSQTVTCSQGFYRAGTKCVSCGGRGWMSPAGATSYDQCVCQPGFGGGSCRICPTATYSPGGSRAPCTPCGDYQHSPVGSEGVAMCTCLAGYGSSDNQRCTPCPIGTYGEGPLRFAGPNNRKLAQAATSTVRAKQTTPTNINARALLPCQQCPNEGTTRSVGTASPRQCLTSCAPGSGSATNGADCQACPDGFYGEGGLQPCRQCPANTQSLRGATSISACGAQPGFYRRSDGIITPCTSGFYCPGASFTTTKTARKEKSGSKAASVVTVMSIVSGSEAQVACPSGTESPPRAETADQCICKPGTGGENCAACLDGFYSAGGTSAACMACPANMRTFKSGATSVSECACKAGYGRDAAAGPDAGCGACPVGYTSAGGSRDSCIPNLNPGTCPAGQGSTDGGKTCVECNAGFYSPGGSGSCTACPANTFSLPGANSPSDCGANPGYYRSGATITLCEAGNYCPGATITPGTNILNIGLERQVPCPPNTNSPAGANWLSQCTCKAGYGREPSTPADAACTICPKGSYSAGGSRDSQCLPCPDDGTTTSTGATNVTACGWSCQPGEGSSDGGKTCSSCPAGTYSQGGTGACAQCPANTSSMPGAAGIAQCGAMPGYYRSGSSIVQCSPGFYCPGATATGNSTGAFMIGMERQIPCPPNSNSVAGASAASQCICLPGYGSDECTPCTPGTYSLGGLCVPCGPNQSSPPMATSAAACFCLGGYGGQFCQQCPPDTYGMIGAANKANCVSCTTVDPNAGAPAGSDDPTDCNCKPGFVRVFVDGNGTPLVSLPPNAPVNPSPSPTNTTNTTLPTPMPATIPSKCVLCGSLPIGYCSNPFGNNNTVLSCPSNTFPVVYGTSSFCRCKAGYGAPATGSIMSSGCDICPAGTFSTQFQDTCQTCSSAVSAILGQPVPQDGFTTAPAATAASSCMCKPGHGGPTCEMCPVGFFSVGVNGSRADCVSCLTVLPNSNTKEPGARSHQSCVCQPGFGGASCSACPDGFYSPGGSWDACTPCPSNMLTFKNGATSLSECMCKAGYGRDADTPASDGCSACDVGFYSTGGSRDSCSQCPSGSSTGSDTGATNVTQCGWSCPAGQGSTDGGRTCLTCEVGTYSPGGSGPCMPCPANSYSLPGATAPADCGANPGYWRNGSMIVLCSPGFYCPGAMPGAVGLERPQACPPNTHSLPGASSETECVCKANFGGPFCEPCEPGEYSDGVSRDSCLKTLGCAAGQFSTDGGKTCSQCQAGTYSTGGPGNSSCIACPPNTYSLAGATSQADCGALPGYFRNGTAIQLCPPGFYCEGAVPDAFTGRFGLERAVPCPPDTNSSAGAELCFCNANFGGAMCEPCPEGYASPGGSRDSCQKVDGCPPGQESSDGGKTCIECGPGFWSAGGAGNSTCRQCTNGTYSLPGAVSPAECGAKAGYYRDGADVALCKAGNYCPGASTVATKLNVGLESQIPCPPNTNSSTGAISVAQCTCLPGFGKEPTASSSEGCEMCQDGYFSVGGTHGPCLRCPSGSNTRGQTGSTDISACAYSCQPGSGSFDGGKTCVECAQGYWSNGGTGNCTACPAKTSSPAGAVSPSQCGALPGYYSNGTSLEECQEGFYCPETVFGYSYRLPCPLNSISAKGASLVSQCTCLPGYGAANQGCEPCAPGTYSSGGLCVPCGPNQSSPPMANSSALCYCMAGFGGVDCEACPVNTFGESGRAGKPACTSCTTVDPNSGSPAGSKVGSDCRCKPGFIEVFVDSTGTPLINLYSTTTPSINHSVPIATKCILCGSLPFGYCDNGTSVTACPANTFPVAFGQSSFCRCKAGYGAPTSGNILTTGCELCPAGTFAARAQDSCQTCASAVAAALGQAVAPEGFTTAPGSISVDGCMCKAGFGGPTCSQCPKDFFSTGDRSRAECTSCASVMPNTQTMAAGARSADACTCRPGFGFNGTSCTACPDGFWSAGGNTPCQACPANMFTGKASATSADECVCKAGYGRGAADVPTAGCSACAAGFFSNGGTRDSCRQCPSGQGTGTQTGANSTQCGWSCAPGEGSTDDGRSCTTCPAGYYSTGGTTSCTQCPDNTFSLPGAVSAAQCGANPGYWRNGTASVVQCTPGFYCPGAQLNSTSSAGLVIGLERQLPCPPNSNSTPGASSASQCLCEAGYGGPDCDPCSAGSYSKGESQKACMLCGSNQSSPPRATDASACYCLPGFGGVNCQRCAAGTYSPGGSKAACSSCADMDPNSSSVAGSEDPSDCTCRAGFTKVFIDKNGTPLISLSPNATSDITQNSSIASKCILCGSLPIGYCEEGSGSNPGTVTACPSNTFPVVYGTSSFCRCKAGYGAPATGSIMSSGCDICPAGTYAVQAQDSCQTCASAVAAALGQAVSQEGFTTATGSSAAGSCVCKAGFGGPACSQCVEGFFSTGNSSRAECTSCSDVLQNSLTLQPGATAASDCVCKPGYGYKATSCTVCSLGFWSAGNARQPCNACPPNMVTNTVGAVSAEDCVCKPGFGREADAAASSGCTACAAGFYSPGFSRDSCQQCPDGQSTGGFTGASNVTQCGYSCPPGQGSNDGGKSCSTCPAGFYSIGGTEACVRCPANTFSLAGAAGAAECGANPGYWRNGTSEVIKCEPGFYCPGAQLKDASSSLLNIGFERQLACPPNSISAAGASSPSQCLCDPGYGGANCDPCKPGTYSEGNTRQACLSCGDNQSSPPMATGMDSCYCNGGSGWDGLINECVRCPAGTYGLPGQYGHQACQNCTAVDPNMVSAAGSDDPSDCSCKQGFAKVFVDTDGTPLIALYPNSTATVPNNTTLPMKCVACGTLPIGYCENGTVTACPSNTFPVVYGTSSFCRCKAGYGAPATGSIMSSGCDICPAGTFAAQAQDSCQTCASAVAAALGQAVAQEGFTTAPGSTVESNCVCKAGYGGSKCEICPVGFFAPGNSSRSECSSCADVLENSYTTAEGSKSASDCICKPGFGFTNATCTLCPAGFWSTGGKQPCTPCPSNMDTLVNGSTSQDQCMCKPGHGYDTTSGTCRVCSVGEYAAGGSRDSCTSCGPTATTMSEKSTSVADCACPEGREIANATEHGITCVECGFNFYKPRIGREACTACPGNSTRTLQRGSTTSRQCVCAPGYGSSMLYDPDTDEGDGLLTDPSTGDPVCNMCVAPEYSPGSTNNTVPYPPCRRCIDPDYSVSDINMNCIGTGIRKPGVACVYTAGNFSTNQCE